MEGSRVKNSSSKKRDRTSTKEKEKKKSTPIEYNGPDLKTKDGLVQELAKRYWYVWPRWPPENYDYSATLKENGLRQVELQSWILEPDEVNELKKVVELDDFEGVFTDYKG